MQGGQGPATNGFQCSLILCLTMAVSLLLETLEPYCSESMTLSYHFMTSLLPHPHLHCSIQEPFVINIPTLQVRAEYNLAESYEK